MTPCIICVAITGSLPTKAHNPAVPITIEEQIDSACEAFEAGASIVHLHVRNADESPSSDPEKFAAFKEGMHKACPEMIIQFSTGGRSGAGRQRGGMLCHAPDMASLTVGSNNFPNRVYDNEPALIDWLAAEMQRYQIKPELEIFDLSHLFKAKDMLEQGQLSENPYMQFVMGVKNAMPADRQVFDFYIQKVYVRKNNKAWAEWCPTNDEQTFKMGKKEAFCQVAAFKHRNMLIWGDTVVNFIEPSWKMRYRYAKPGQTYADSQPNGLERGTCEFWER